MRVQEEIKKKKKTKVKEETREFTMGKTKGAKENIVSRAKKKIIFIRVVMRHMEEIVFQKNNL